MRLGQALRLGAIAAVALAASPAGTHAQGPTLVVSKISAVEGQTFNGVVAVVTVPCDKVDSAVIDWGDQSASVGNKTPDPQNASNCDINGSQIYAEESPPGAPYATNVTVNGTGFSDTSHGTATVADSPFSGTGQAVSATAGTSLTDIVATFSDPGIEPAGSYTATIDWGDGHVSTGTINGNAVRGSNIYAAAGSYRVTVTVNEDGGQSAAILGSATVAPPNECSPQPSAPSAAFRAAGATPNERYVEGLYNDLLNSPTGGSGRVFVNELDSGVPRGDVALQLATTNGYRVGLINGYYLRLLRRPSDAAARATFVSYLARTGTDEGVAAGIVGSQEYFNVRGAGTTDGFIRAAYCDLLARTPNASDLAASEAQFATGGVTVALALTGSEEYRQDLVRAWYARFMRRTATAAELRALGAVLRNGATDEQTIAALLSSPEYFALFNATGDTIAAPAISHLGVVTLTLLHPATLDLKVFAVVRPRSGAPPTLLSARRRRVAIRPPTLRAVGAVGLGSPKPGAITLHWNRRVGGRRLKRGHYMLVLEARSGRKLIDVSNSFGFRIS